MPSCLELSSAIVTSGLSTRWKSVRLAEIAKLALTTAITDVAIALNQAQRRLRRCQDFLQAGHLRAILFRHAPQLRPPPAHLVPVQRLQRRRQRRMLVVSCAAGE